MRTPSEAPLILLSLVVGESSGTGGSALGETCASLGVGETCASLVGETCGCLGVDVVLGGVVESSIKEISS